MLPPWRLLAYLLISAVTYFTYGNDKTRAVTGQRRVPERQLHVLELLGRWPGALVAQSSFRHKNRKPSYQVTHWTMVLLNLLLLGLFVLGSYGPAGEQLGRLFR